MHEAAYRALRADANVKTSWDEFRAPPAFISNGAQLPGHRFALALTDSASAARFGLHTAKLINGAGQAVAATDIAILKGIGTMKDSDVAGVKVVDSAARVTGAYPLSMLTYAGVNVCAATRAELANYSQLLTFAAGAGQVSGDAKGQLPQGYVPLGPGLSAQTMASVTVLSKQAAGTGPCVVAAPVTVPELTPEPLPSSTDTNSVTVPTADPEELVSGKTVDQPLPLSRLGLAAALALGIPTMIAGPFLTRKGRRLASLEELV